MSKATLKALSDSTFTTNGVRGITAEDHRSFNETAIASMYIDPGTVVAWAGLIAHVPAGWYVCNGTQLSKTTYVDLFAALGGELSPWGVQDTTFSIPNIPIYGSPVQANQYAENVVGGSNKLGLTGGNQTETLTESQIPSHNHGLRIPTYGETGATSRIANAGTDYEGTIFLGATEYKGGGGSHNNMQPFAAMYWIIKII